MVLEKLIGKTEDSVTRMDIIPLLRAPLMGGRSEQKDRILRCISILKMRKLFFKKVKSRKWKQSCMFWHQNFWITKN